VRIFAFDPADYRDVYARDGWVHIPNGISPDFLAALREFVERSLREHHVEGTSIAGSKDQSMFEFPEDSDFPGELFDAIAEMCGLNRGTMTLSERHVKAYHADTPPEQVPHKDRFASQVSVGLSIDIPVESRLLLYPHDHVGENPYNISGALPNSLPPEERPETIAASAREVEVDDADGDVVAFRGSAIWHCRRRAAGAVNLYLKMNDFGSDPLGEDPTTASRRQATLSALENGSDLDDLVPILARRLDYFSRSYTRDTWREVLQAHVFDQTPLQLSSQDFELLRTLDGQRPAGPLIDDLGGDRNEVQSRLRHLAGSEVIDLLPAASH
jgi:hypothetical protein